MEYGLIPKIDQFRDTQALEVQKINPTNETTKVSGEKELSLLEEEFLKSEKIQKAKAVTEAFNIPKYEVSLANYNFGFNDKSHDFFVKVTRGDAQNQYPTEDMMRLKAYLMSLNKAELQTS